MVAAQDDQVTVEAGSGMTAAESAEPAPAPAEPVVATAPTPQPAATPAAPAVAPKPVAQSTTNDKRWANWFSQQQSAPQSATKAGSSYTVRSGDTLSVIARRHGVSIATLAQANNLTNPNALRIGQVLTIPSAAGSSAVAAPVISAPATTAPAAPAAPAAAPAAPVTAGGYYTVAKGDTLSGIARRHGTTIAKIMQANRMTTAQAHKLSIGQKIIIPNN